MNRMANRKPRKKTTSRSQVAGWEAGLSFEMDSRTFATTPMLTLQTSLGELDLLDAVAGIGDYDRVLIASEEVEAFDGAKDPDAAYGAFVDRLLAIQGTAPRADAFAWRLVNPPPDVRQLLELVRLHRVFEITPPGIPEMAAL